MAGVARGGRCESKGGGGGSLLYYFVRLLLDQGASVCKVSIGLIGILWLSSFFFLKRELWLSSFFSKKQM
jgi:hypothetical protein